jgi:hypothetical protein
MRILTLIAALHAPPQSQPPQCSRNGREQYSQFNGDIDLIDLSRNRWFIPKGNAAARVPDAKVH